MARQIEEQGLMKMEKPEYRWKHYSPNNVFEIYGVIKESERLYRVTWNFMFDGSKKEIIVVPEPSETIGVKLFESTWSTMDTFTYDVGSYIIKAIFNNMKVY